MNPFRNDRMARQSRPRVKNVNLGFERLEDHMVPATLSISNGVLSYTAAAGEFNNLTVSRTGSTVTFNDTGAILTAFGSGFTTVNSRTVTVSEGLFNSMTLNLGDMNDTMTLQSSNRACVVNAGTGNDTINIGAGDLDTVHGAVTVNGQGGTDTINLMDQIAPWDDTYYITASVVTRRFSSSGELTWFGNLTFSNTTENLALNAETGGNVITIADTNGVTRVTVDAGGGDDTVNGGPGDDRILGGNGNDSLYGGAGNDYLNGGAHNDRLYGQAGNDRVYGDLGIDSLYGGSENDGLFGGVGGFSEVLDGGSGNDRLLYHGQTPGHPSGSPDAVIHFNDDELDWNNREIEEIDVAFAEMQAATGGATWILKDSFTTDPLLFQKIPLVTSSTNVVTTGRNVSWWRPAEWERVICIADWDETLAGSNQSMRGTVIHEMAHNWDGSPDEDNIYWGAFNGLHYNSTKTPNYAATPNGTNSPDFARDYGQTNAQEDWATVWELYFGYISGPSSPSTRLQNKLDLVESFITGQPTGEGSYGGGGGSSGGVNDPPIYQN